MLPESFISLVISILFFVMMIALTVVIETPVIVRGGVTENRRYICAVNIVTNVILNMVLAGLLLLTPRVPDEELIRTVGRAWFFLAELILIPLSEGFLYKKISSAGIKRILLFTYLANFASCGAGIVLDLIIRLWGQAR